MQAARGVRRRRAQEDGAAASKLSPACDALVRLAEPGDVYAHYNTAMSAAAVSTQIKAMEQRLGLKVRSTPLIVARWHDASSCRSHARRHSRNLWQCSVARIPANEAAGSALFLSPPQTTAAEAETSRPSAPSAWSAVRRRGP